VLNRLRQILFDFAGSRTYHRAPMPNALPDTLDPWRSVQARRRFEGTLPLERLQRLGGLLASSEGELHYSVEFGSDEFDIAFVDLKVDVGLPMVCQRTLQVFVDPVRIDQRLGLIGNEADEAALPADYEALLVADGQLNLQDVIEDELILAVPLVALSPGAPLEDLPLGDSAPAEAELPPNPFAALGRLKKSQD
jgi:uncharacterized protein